MKTEADQLVEQLHREGIHDPAVLEAIRNTPREHFLPPSLRELAYANQALPIDCEQTISQPFIVALMTEALELQPDDRVLEIGTGSGYQTAILAGLCSQVETIERWDDLSRQARERLGELGIKNVNFRIGDGTCGWPEEAPFDAIIVTAACQKIPEPYFNQLKPEGRLVIPLGDDYIQELIQATRTETGWSKKRLCGCRFVKLIGEYGW